MEMTFLSCMIGCSALREQRSLYAPPLLAKRPLHLRRETQNSAPLRFSEDETRVIRLGPTVRSIPNCVSRTLVASTARGLVPCTHHSCRRANNSYLRNVFPLALNRYP